MAYLDAGETDKGLEILERLAGEPAPIAEVLYNLAIAHERAGKKLEAAKVFRRFLELDGQSGWARLAKQKLEALK